MYQIVQIDHQTKKFDSVERKGFSDAIKADSFKDVIVLSSYKPLTQ